MLPGIVADAGDDEAAAAVAVDFLGREVSAAENGRGAVDGGGEDVLRAIADAGTAAAAGAVAALIAKKGSCKEDFDFEDDFDDFDLTDEKETAKEDQEPAEDFQSWEHTGEQAATDDTESEESEETADTNDSENWWTQFTNWLKGLFGQNNN